MSEHKYKFHELVSAVGDLDIPGTLGIVKDLASRGVTPRAIQQSVEIGMKLVGEYYRAGDYFLADLLFAGRLYETVLQQKEMIAIHETLECRTVTGMVPGDLHDIGKRIVSATLGSYGFQSISLDPHETDESFIRAVLHHAPHIVIIGSMAPEAPASLPRLLRSIRDSLPDGCTILLGGNLNLAANCRSIGADYYVTDALNALDQCLAVYRKTAP